MGSMGQTLRSTLTCALETERVSRYALQVYLTGRALDQIEKLYRQENVIAFFALGVKQYARNLQLG